MAEVTELLQGEHGIKDWVEAKYTVELDIEKLGDILGDVACQDHHAGDIHAGAHVQHGGNAHQLAHALESGAAQLLGLLEDLVHIPDIKANATVGYSVEAIKKCLDGVTNTQVDVTGTMKPLIECVQSGVLRGAMAFVGCNNPKVRPDPACGS